MVGAATERIEVATVVVVVVGREVVGLAAAGEFQSEVIGFSQNQGVQFNGGL